jgi:hypothetical protein
VLGLQAGDKVPASNWREVRDMKGRCLAGSMITPGIMDGLSGLERVFIIERVNKKFEPNQTYENRRRNDVLLHVAASYLSENGLTWRSKPIGKVSTKLPFLKCLAQNSFTQNS